MRQVKKKFYRLSEVKFYDMIGRIIQVSGLKNLINNKNVDISNLPVGIYNLIIESDYGQIRERLIKY